MLAKADICVLPIGAFGDDSGNQKLDEHHTESQKQSGVNPGVRGFRKHRKHSFPASGPTSRAGDLR
jgi:hypothetical protein